VATSVHDAGLKRIGRYELVRHLATGGMAEIYVARLSGIGGFQRHVTLKTIRPERVEDEAFVHMFLDEARLVAALHHHNVCQVHDVGVDQGTYYLALEYVHGESSRAILERARDLNVTIPLEISLAIVAGAASGLHHSHEARNPDGTPIGLVHRDVSPSNILVGYDGSVKLIDFGIARAQAGRHTETQTGMIKGKFGYMSPEQCRGWPVDRRSDVFGLGIVLYELTTQTRAFRAENDYETMQRIVRGDVTRPSRVSSGYPLDLELVVLRALSVDPTARFPTSAAMLEMIERCARRVGGLASPATVGRFLNDLFGARHEPWREDEDDRTDDGSVEEIELIDSFDGPSSLGIASVRSVGDSTALRSAVTPMQPSVEADVITMTASVPLPGLPAALGAAPLSPLALYAEAEAEVRPRPRLASGTQPLPMSDAMAVPASEAPTPAWERPADRPTDRQAPPPFADAPMYIAPQTSGRAATAIVTPLHTALTLALRNRWVWIGVGAALGILVGVGVGVAVAPSEPEDDHPAAAAGAPSALAPEIGQAEVLPDAAAEVREVREVRDAAAEMAIAPAVGPWGTRPAPAVAPDPAVAAAPDRVLIRITSEPSKATVLLDGKRLGKTPFVGALRSSDVGAVIKVRRRGYKTMRVDVDRSQDIRLHVELPELK
jgi:eukaryotic-like serine/threonine-protein kinase